MPAAAGRSQLSGEQVGHAHAGDFFQRPRRAHRETLRVIHADFAQLFERAFVLDRTPR